MSTLYLDTETFSVVPIKHGAHRYAEQAEVMLVPYAWDDEPVEVWDTQDRPHWRAELQEMIDYAERVVIHNSAFDRTVLRENGVKIPVEKIEDTMILALAHSLPGKLEQLGEALRLPVDKAKDKDGKRLIQLFTKPRPKNTKIRRATRETHPDDWQRFIAYAARDVDAMRDVRRLLPRWNATKSEHELWRLDQDINDRGVAVDIELADAAVRAFDRTLRTLSDDTKRLTGGEVTSLTQRDKFITYLRQQGVELPDLTKGTVAKLLETELPGDIRRLLEIRQQASATSPAKYAALRDAASSDGRLRGTIQFCGAGRTGRDAGRIFQPQNLPRSPDWFDGEVQELTVAAFKADCEHVLWDNISERCAFAVRGSLVAAPGRKLVIADLSNIEGRVLAWMADEQWKIDAFKAYDRGDGPDLYKVTAGRILGKDPYEVTKEERQLQGKVPELACLGPHTRVITKSGVKLITAITPEDKLWDGVEWVENTGLVERGLKQVLRLDGVEMTPDHNILCGETWLSAQMVATCPNSRALASETGSASLRWLGLTSALEAASAPCVSHALVETGRTAWTSTTSDAARLHVATNAPSRKQAVGQNNGSGTPIYAPTTPIGDDCATAYLHASTDATTRKTKDTPTTGVAASQSTSLGGWIVRSFWRTLSLLKGGIGQSWNWIASTSTVGMSRGTYVSLPAAPTETTSARSEISSSAYLSWKSTYDIANAGPRNRFTILTDSGALVVHNCGYGGSLGAFRTMGGRALDSLSDETIAGIVQDWRRAHPATKRFWYDVEGMVRCAIRSPGEQFNVRGIVHADCVDGPDGVGYARIKLPSGRYLCYRDMRIADDGQLLYEGLNQYTRKWQTLETYYGKLVENIVQAVARDVFMSGMRRAELSGYPVVLRVHDELVCEVPDDPAFNHTKLAEMMATNPSWSTGLPLAAAGFEAVRYRKE